MSTGLVHSHSPRGQLELLTRNVTWVGPELLVALQTCQS
jgi:hypothetical protein